MKDELWDKDLGRIVISRNYRAKRLIARRRADHYQFTIPFGYPISKVEKFLSEMKPRLLQLKSVTKLFFDEQTALQTLTFGVDIKKQDVNNYCTSLKDGALRITCPALIDFNDEAIQDKIRLIVETALRNEAKRVFPDLVNGLANKYGFTYSEVKINKSRSRWGSCSSKKSINLSYFCLFLPAHLIDFIVLHELCHTIEMNHGEHFWALLDKVTGNVARELTKELKREKISW